MTKEEINKLREDTRTLFDKKFGDIVFDEIPHKYYIDGKEYTPVSHIISEYENEFDLEAHSKRKAEQLGISQDEVKKMWKLNNLEATVMGTRSHEFGESYVNMLIGHTELICEQNKPQYIADENWLIPTYPQEFAIRKFYEELNPNLHLISAEAKLSTKYIKGARPICGTADILFYYDAPDPSKSGYVLGDYKTNKELIKSYIRDNNILMKYPFDTIGFYDDALCHYYLQFNLYQRMMESIGLNIIARRLVWIKRDGTYEVHAVPKIDDNIIDQVIMWQK